MLVIRSVSHVVCSLQMASRSNRIDHEKKTDLRRYGIGKERNTHRLWTWLKLKFAEKKLNFVAHNKCVIFLLKWSIQIDAIIIRNERRNLLGRNCFKIQWKNIKLRGKLHIFINMMVRCVRSNYQNTLCLSLISAVHLKGEYWVRCNC